jgi:heat shock protein HtpX
MAPSNSLAARAALVIVLLAGFYILAVAIAGILIYLPYAEWTYGGRLHVKLALFCIVGAGAILWSIIPRVDHFTAPGPVLPPNQHRKLFDTLRDIARATGQEMPSEVYLVPEVNAWVSNRGGIMGFGGRRVMGLGLPLLQALTVPQLRAVVAHEFGHFYGGDTKLAPWVYKTRIAIGRTLAGLAEHSSLLQTPFLWYGMFFLKVSNAVSRRQEFAADALAARVVGSRHLIEGLKLTHSAGLIFSAYWRSEVMPVLRNGFRPPLAEGFRHFYASPRIAEWASSSVEQELREGKADPYDTHPSLPERVAALKQWPERETATNDLPAISLIERVDKLEIELIESISAGANTQSLKSVAWENVGQDIWLPGWETETRKYEALAGITAAKLPETSQALSAFASQLGEEVASEEQQKHATAILGMALAVALKAEGWKVHALPGADVICEYKAFSIKPFEIVPKLASGELTPESWNKLCATYGIADLDLGPKTAIPKRLSA